MTGLIDYNKISYLSRPISAPESILSVRKTYSLRIKRVFYLIIIEHLE